MSAQPLAGLRVLELSQYISAPLAGVFLADQGAEVIRVPRPGAVAWSPAGEQTLTRGKRTLDADLKQWAQRDHVLEIAADCDVVLENFRPGVADRLGLGYQAVSERNPAVVYVSLPGYSRHDHRAQQPSWDPTISAACGLFTDLSVGGGLGLPPTYTPLPLPSVYAGLWAATAAAAALYARATTGRGDWIETPLMDAAMSAAAGVIFGLEDQPARFNVPALPADEVEKISFEDLSEEDAAAARATILDGMPAFFRTFVCADGDGLFLCAIDNANQIEKLLAVLEIDAAEFGLRFDDVLEATGAQDNLTAYRGPTEDWLALQRRMAERFATDGATAWQERLARAGVAAARQARTREWTSEPVMRETGVVLECPDATIQPGPQVDVSSRGVATTLPDGGPDTRPATWSAHRAFAPPALRETDAPDAPLAGVRVLDMSNVIAGPAAGRTLAELGAEVLHVSPVAPRMGPRMTLLLGLEVNQGKRSIALDATSDDSRGVLSGLLADADVVLYNKLPAQAERLGVDPETVHGINPRAVVTAVTAYSGVRPGGWEDRRAYDPVVQAATGVMRRFGGDSSPAVHGIASCIDYFTGFSAAFGTIVALLARSHGATHLVTRTSLMRTAGWVQLNCLNGEAVPSGLDARGTRPHDQIYRVRDGWVHVFGIRRPADVADPEAWLEGELAALSVNEVASAMSELGLVAQEVLDVRRLRRAAVQPDNAAAGPGPASGRILLAPHPSGDRAFLTAATWIRPTTAVRHQLTPAPRPGEHTREVLAELGYDAGRIDELIASGTASTGWGVGPRYVPT